MSEKDSWTTIPIRKSTKKLLRKFIGVLAQKTGEDYSYDRVIRTIIKLAPEVPLALIEEKE